jgi:2-amino-4-hydroxy-6-hydroxymethyldihydropteridine diphosphokinase
MLTALGLGSNLGDRLGNLRTALGFLKEQYTILKTSDVFETAPWGVTDQPSFLNACLLMECEVPPETPETLLGQVKAIEKKMGRTETRRWGERIIDIDILLMGSLMYDSPNLHIPHSEMHRRDFVLIPLAQILLEPDAFDSLLGTEPPAIGGAGAAAPVRVAAF